jgi:hypothetical protein
MKHTGLVRLLVVVMTVFGLLWGMAPVMAQDTPVCEIVGKAAGRTIYRCVDEMEGNIIYINDLGFMFAVQW